MASPPFIRWGSVLIIFDAVRYRQDNMEEYRVTTTAEQPSAAIRERVKHADIAPAIGRAYGELAEFIARRGLRMIGPPFVYYHSWTGEETDLECGFPVEGTFEGEGRIRPFTLPAAMVVTGIHVGPYHRLMETYTAMEKWMRSGEYEPAGRMWERYLNEPGKVPDEKLMTEIFWEIK